MHKMNVVHRDIKPENIMLVEKESTLPKIKIIDLGTAMTFKNGELLKQKVGTFNYMAPEILIHPDNSMKPKGYDHLCDMWSLGILSYLMLCDNYPFNFEMVNQTHFKQELADFKPYIDTNQYLDPKNHECWKEKNELGAPTAFS